jgi:hypothetical protein
VSADCTRKWRSCPVHSTGTDALPDFGTVLLCLYGGQKLRDGSGVLDESNFRKFQQRVVDGIEGRGAQSEKAKP